MRLEMGEIIEVANNCLELSIACNAILIGLLAFVYPQIFETKKRLKDISEVFVKKYKNNLVIEYYFPILSILLCSSVIISMFCIFENEKMNCIIVLYLNIILSFIGIIISSCVYHRLEKLYNKPETLFSIKKILKLQKKEDDDLQLIQTLLARNLVNRYDYYNNQYYLLFLKDIFMNNMTKHTELEHEQKYKELSKWCNETRYLYRPLEIMQFINQEAVRCGNEDASVKIIQCVLDIFKEMLLKENLSSLYEQETKVSNTFKRMLIYKISHNSLIPEWDMYLIICYYKMLLDYDKNHIKGMINGNNLNPNENVFQIITYLIKQSDKLDIFVPFLGYLKDMDTPSTNYSSDIQRLNCEILAYMILHKKYSLAYDYMYWQQPLDNSKSIYFFQIIPSTITDIADCYIKKSSIFQENQKFEENEDARIYKVYILFILLYTLKRRSDNANCTSSNSLLINDYTRVDENIFENVDNHSLFFNYITGSNFQRDYAKFIKSKEILQQFRIEDTKVLKEFIQDIFTKITKIIEVRRENILNSPICNADQEAFKTEFKKDHDLFFSCALALKNKINNRNMYTFIKKYFHSKKKKNKSWSRAGYAKGLTTCKEKSRVIATEYTFQMMFTDLLDGLYKELIHKIDNKCIKIKSIKDIQLNNEDTWGIATNFDNFTTTLETLIPKENIIYADDSNFYIEGIKIGNRKIPFVQHNYRYIQNSRKRMVVYIINISNIKLEKKDIDIQFFESKRITANSNDLFPKKYETDKDINIVVSKPFKISFAKNEVIGYKLFQNINNKK